MGFVSCSHTALECFLKQGGRCLGKSGARSPSGSEHQCTTAEREACLEVTVWAFCWCAKCEAEGGWRGAEKRAEKRGYKLWREITAFISKWQLFIFLPQAYLLTSRSVRICWSRRGRLHVLVVHEALILSLLEFRRLPVSNQPPNGQEAPLGMGIWQGLSKLSGSSRGFFILLLLP